MRHLLKNKKNARITVKNSRSPIPQVEEKKKQFTARDVESYGCARWFQHITSQPVKLILHAVDSNILQNITILQEDFGMAEDIYGPSVPHFQGEKFHHKVHHVESTTVTNTPKGILGRYNNITLCCDHMHINCIGFLNNIFWQILFSMGTMIKNQKVKNIEDGIKQFKKLHLQRGFKITQIHADSEFEPLQP